MKMFNLKSIFMLVLLAGSVFSCDEKEEAQPLSVANPTTIVNNVNIKKINYDYGTVTFTYDNNDRLTKVTDSYILEDEDWYSQSTMVYELVFEDDILVGIDKSYDGVDIYGGNEYPESWEEKMEYTYNGKNQVKNVRIVRQGRNDENITREYNSQGKLSKQYYPDDELSVSYEWEGENLKRETGFGIVEDSDAGRKSYLSFKKPRGFRLSGNAKVKSEILMTELVIDGNDDKKNPLWIFSILYDEIPGWILSKNNTTKYHGKSFDEFGNVGYGWWVEVKCEYNSDGYPVKMNITETDSEEDIYTETYIIEYR